MKLRYQRQVANSLVSILIFTWLAIFCQHCIALAEPEPTTSSISHDHCVTQIESEKETNLNLPCITDCDDISTIHDTNSQQQNDHKTYKQSVLASEFYPVNFQKLPDVLVQKPKPDQAISLPFELYTVQLK